MKITFVIPHADFSGGIRVIAIYAERLKQRGHEVLVVSTPKPRPPLREQFRSLRKGKGWIPYKEVEPSHFDNSVVPLKVIDRYRPITDADVPDADVVIATWWETAAWVARLSPSKGAKAYFMQDYGAPGQELEQIVPTWSLPLHIITIAQWLGNLITEHCGNIPLTIVPNAVDFDLFYAEPRGKQTQPTIGFNYRLMESKGTDIALKAIELASRSIPDLRVIGFGSEKPTSPLPTHITYHYRPSNSQIREIYAACDAWLFSSRREGYGLPILEAMVCRAPVIATPAGAAPELLERGGGILVKPEDPVDMATAIQTICQLSEADWKALSDRAYETVVGYTWEDATDRFEAGLHTAIDRSKRNDFSTASKR
jgi:glycosyltransferase involved in cell wall biosynthesis